MRKAECGKIEVRPSLNSFLQIISIYLYLPCPTLSNLWLTTDYFVHNTIQVGLPTLEPACQRGLLLALKIAFFLSLKSITLSLLLILTTIRYMMETGQRLLYIAMFVMENGRGWMAVKRQPFAGFVNNQNTLCKCS